MLFTSQIFFVLLAVTFILYYVPLVKQFQIYILVISSLIFYGYFNPVLLLLLLVSILLNTTGSYFIYYGNFKFNKIVLYTCVTSNLLILIFFKYSPLFVKTLFVTNSSVGQFLLTIPLPLGISFFTFEGISLLVDTARNQTNPDPANNFTLKKSFARQLTETSLFISFFPHLIAGPILKAADFLPQIGAKLFKNINWGHCVKLLITGYFLKMVVADNLKQQVAYLDYPYFLNLPSSVSLTMIFGFSMQIFADFAGYSLIALGLAALFGYRLNINFNYPYISASFTEFWQRWHISLSSFLKKYLYFPLGGNRKGKARTYFNLFIVMFLGGLWHGAAWSFAAWGFCHGLLLATERLFGDMGIKSNPTRLYKALKIALVFLSVTFLWILFRMQGIMPVVKYLNSIYHNVNIPLTPVWDKVIVYIAIYSVPVILYHAYYLYKVNGKKNEYLRFEPVFYGIMLFLIFTNSGISGSFIYFQF